MPYVWNDPQSRDESVRLSLWPHRSLPRRGFAAFLLGTFTLITIPLYPLLGTVVLWGILPFMLLALGGIWWALEQSYRTARMREELSLSPSEVQVRRINPGGDVQEWRCNRYWARVQIHPKGGPVAQYLTLKGDGREVELGAFLSEDERVALFGELSGLLSQRPSPEA